MATLYYNAAVDTDWNNLGNWWMDDTFTIPASSLPTSIDSIVLSNTCDTNSGSEPTVTSLTFNDPAMSYFFLGINITVTGIAGFYGGSYFGGGNGNQLTGNANFDTEAGINVGSAVTGNATFNDTSYNLGTVAGDAFFNDYSYNNGTVTGNATFNGNSYNYGNVIGTATFNDGTGVYYGNFGLAVFNTNSFVDSSAGITGNAVFNDSTYNNGTITGNCEFNVYSTNNGTITGNCEFNDYSSNNTGTITGNCIFNNNAGNFSIIIGNCIFNNGSAHAYGTVTGDATFNDGSYSYSTVSGNATFNGGSYNGGTVSLDATFNDSSYNNNGTLNGDATFNGSSYNNGYVTGNATFNVESYNNVTVNGDATFNDISYNNYGNVTGTATFNDYSYNNAGIVSLDATFNEYSHNDGGTVNGNATFNGISYNSGAVLVNATFNNNSYNIGIIDGYSYFNDSSFAYTVLYGASYGNTPIFQNRTPYPLKRSVNSANILGVLSSKTGPTINNNPPSPSLLLNFDGNFNDSSSNNIQVYPMGSPSINTSTPKHGSGAGYFNGSNYLTMSLSPLYDNDFTIDFWLNRLGYSTNQYGVGCLLAVGEIQGAVGGLHLGFNNDSSIYVNDGFTVDINGGNVPFNEWHHIALVRLGAINILYVDGLEVDRGYQTFPVTNSVLEIGGTPRYGFYANCLIDDFRITAGRLWFTN